MNTEEAKQLKPNTIVMTRGQPEDIGTVVYVGIKVFKISWENGDIELVLFNRAEDIDICEKQEPKIKTDDEVLEEMIDAVKQINVNPPNTRFKSAKLFEQRKRKHP